MANIAPPKSNDEEMVLTKRLSIDVKKLGSRKKAYSDTKGSIKRICITGGACAGKTTALASIS